MSQAYQCIAGSPPSESDNRDVKVVGTSVAVKTIKDVVSFLSCKLRTASVRLESGSRAKR